jgi:hypothetical protein
MSQLVRIQNEVIHVPSVARTRFYSSPLLGRPFVKVVHHDGHEYILKYKVNQWPTATTEFKKLEVARAACYDALKKIPLMEESETYNPLVESERKLQ